MRPFFVYGTLLPNQPNHFLVSHAVSKLEPATLADATLYDYGGVPMMRWLAGGSVQGMLLTMNQVQYAQTLTALDALEQYLPDVPEQSLYLREVCTVRLGNDMSREAWVYVGSERYVAGLEPFGGDWLRYSAEYRSKITAWWNQDN